MLKDPASASSEATTGYAFGPHRLDVAGRTLTTNGEPVTLTPKAFDLLVVLVEHRQRVMTKDELIRTVWPDTFVSDDSLTQQISTVRKALGETGQQFIATFPRRGYRFVAEVVTDRSGSADSTRPSDTSGERVSRAASGFGFPLAVVLSFVAIATLVWFAGRQWNRGTSSGSATAPVRLTTAGGMVTMPAISKDGTMIAYAAAAPGESHFDISVQHVAGGQPLRLTNDPRDDLYPAFSPDGATIAFHRPEGAAVAAHRTGSLGSTGIYLVPTLGGEPRLFVPGASGAWPSFSPDGRWLAYVEGRGVAANRLFVAPVAGGVPKRLARDLAMVDRFVWSPDGAHVLALGHRERWPPLQNDWFLAPVDGGPAVETAVRTTLVNTAAGSTLLGEGVRAFLPKPQAWLPEDNRIVFHMPQGDTRNLWQVRIDPIAHRIIGRPERLTRGTDNEELASVSATGRMVYTSYDFRVDLWSVPLAADGLSPAGPLQQLTNDVVDDFNPDVSKDGRYVAFASRRRGQDFVVVTRDLVSGRERESGTFSGMPGPLFKPDGHRLAYSIRRPGGGALFIEDLDTGAVQQVCDACGVATQWHPANGLVIGSLWSRDGLTSLAPAEPRVRTLLKLDGLYLFVPSFSPDGKWLTFSVALEDSEAFLPSIVIAPVQDGIPGPRASWVTVAEGHQLGRWSSKGDALFFWTACEGMPCICAQRLDDATKRPVGARIEIVRLAERTLSPRDLEPSNGFGVGRDRIVFPLGSRRGNLWMTDLLSSRD
jgi:DNA-binding winged helix-turn-helix (wHTH) protein